MSRHPVIDPLDALPRRRLLERIVHGIGWRVAGIRSRLQDGFPPFFPVLRELQNVCAKPEREIAGDLVHAWVRCGFSPPLFASLMLWEVPRERYGEFLISKDIDPFLVRLLDPADRTLTYDKTACAEVDRERGVPWLPTLAVVNRLSGLPAKHAVVIRRAVELWPELLRLSSRGEIALKPASGLQGRGFYAVTNGGVFDADGRKITPDELARRVFAYRHAGRDSGYLVQPLLRPHPDMVDLTGVDALATLRIVTVRHAERHFALQALLKIPAPGRLTDNFRRGVSGTFIAAVDPSSGRLSDLVGRVRPDHRFVLERTASHPLTGRRVGGRELPNWQEALDVALRAAAARPNSPIFGWDVAMGPDGWTILDANAVWGPVGAQACLGEGLRPTLTRLYPENWPANAS